MNRRAFVQSLCAGLGTVGLRGALHGATPHFAPRAKHLIVLFMTGGPSQMDLFDPKPALMKYAGQRPASVDLRTERVTGGLLPSPFAFKKHGRNSVEVSELLPRLAGVIDEVCVLRSVYTFNPTHTPARSLIHSGNISAVRPSIGAWISYGLGTENQNLPGFVVLSGGASGLWRSGFLPAEHQGTQIARVEPVPDKMVRYLRNARLDAEAQRRQIDLMQAMNRGHNEEFGGDEFLDGRIQAMETAFRMQFAASDAFELKQEPDAVREEYGSTQFGQQCLLARRCVERGVRSVFIYYGNGQPWDDHQKIEKNLRGRCPDMDQASAALIADLKRRGLLDETLIVWGGEFGRTPVSESGDGRDHNPYGFTMWMAGGGVRGGMAYGATDEFGFKAVENRVSVHDLHATILHQMGLDHEKLTYRYAGRDFRLTDVHGEVVKAVLA
ncbi:MAG: DUF1501 domain-containing protein [Acidobacteria bacterium]|nr:DUF1501 domain-containing protein [Acidobacteriota bacterium]